MRQMIAGNWKMNGLTAESEALAVAIRDGLPGGVGVDVLVCPPFTQLASVGRILAGSAVAWGGQDCIMHEHGAHTGDVAATMLRDLGASHVILGHSERRRDHNEIDETVREKAVAAGRAGLIPIICVGESEEQRASGQHEDVVGWQIKGSVPEAFEGIVAYEPVWAIGTGRSATEADVAAMHGFVRAELVRQFGEARGSGFRILYGGSVSAANASALLAVPEVGGALVGGASLKAAEFLSIVRSASSATERSASSATERSASSATEQSARA